MVNARSVIWMTGVGIRRAEAEEDVRQRDEDQEGEKRQHKKRAHAASLDNEKRHGPPWRRRQRRHEGPPLSPPGRCYRLLLPDGPDPPRSAPPTGRLELLAIPSSPRFSACSRAAVRQYAAVPAVPGVPEDGRLPPLVTVAVGVGFGGGRLLLGCLPGLRRLVPSSRLFLPCRSAAPDLPLWMPGVYLPQAVPAVPVKAGDLSGWPPPGARRIPAMPGLVGSCSRSTGTGRTTHRLSAGRYRPHRQRRCRGAGRSPGFRGRRRRCGSSFGSTRRILPDGW